MAGTIVQGAVSTEEVLSEGRAPDVSARIRRLHLDETALTTMSDARSCAGDLAFLTVGGRLRFSTSDLDVYLDAVRFKRRAGR